MVQYTLKKNALRAPSSSQLEDKAPRQSGTCQGT
jgi:hypothetical protein